MLWQSKSSIRTGVVLYTKTGMGDGQQANNPWLQEFPIQLQEFRDNYVTVLMQMLKIRNSNEIVANGGLNGSYATITTADGS
jgi:molybdopterin-containing oxidoreductase family iron-sulfur binding subunit